MEARVQWNRGELKGRSKSVLQIHYWRIVFMTVLLSLLIGSDSIVSGMIQPFLNEVSVSSDVLQDSPDEELVQISPNLESWIQDCRDLLLGGKSYGSVAFMGIAAIAFVVLSIIAAASGILMEIFVVNPLYVGATRFYVRSFDVKPHFKELFYVFEDKYKNVVGIMFLRDLYTILWCLLFVIPGIVKSYEYSMIPYLLAENPGMEAKDAFAVSRQMMKGQKWNAFVLDLSFLGWKILSAMTFGVLGIFFVNPYSKLAGAALYRKLRGLDQIPHNIYYDGMEQDTVQGWYERPR